MQAPPLCRHGRCDRSDGRDDVVVVQPRVARAEGVRAGPADVDDGEHLVAAAGEELLGDPFGVEPGHRPSGQPGRAYADDEVADLDGTVEGAILTRASASPARLSLASARGGYTTGRCSWNAV